MSRLDELIKELCPEGVEFKALCEATTMSAGDRVTKANMLREGLYPVMGAGVVPTGRYNEWNRENCITISRAGAGAGSVGWHSEKFWATDVCFTAEEKTETALIKYIYYAVTAQETELKKHIYGGSMPKINKAYLWTLSIPIPPLEVQREIVRILDNFTELTAELTTKLTAELTARKKQYEYYRDQLLSFGSEVEQKRLGELFPFIRNGFVGTVTPYYTDEEHGVRYLEGTNIHNGVISDNEVLYVTREFHQKHIKNELKQDDILMVQSGHVGECAVVGDKYSGANCHALIIMSNGGECNSKYVCHYFHTHQGFKSLAPAMTGGTVKHVLATKMKDIRIPVPSRAVQEKIVYILDNFETVCNDLNIGLPAEIEARQRQYEFYRDRLLTFKEKENADE